MTSQQSLERSIRAWMAADAEAVPVPGSLADEIIAATAEVRPMPTLVALLREPAMTGRRRGVAVGVPTRRIVLAAMLLLLLVAAIAVGALLLNRPREDVWPGYRGDAGRTAIASRGPLGNPVIRWEAHFGSSIAFDIAIARGNALVPTEDGVLHALAMADGTERWTLVADRPMHGPFAVGDRAYVVDGIGDVYAIDSVDGSQVWHAPVALATPSDIAVDAGRVFVPTGDGDLVALDAATGAELWRRTVAAGKPVHPPAVGGGIVVAAAEDATFVAFDVATGRERWRTVIGSFPVGAPVVADGVAYLGGGATTPGASLVAFDLETGAERWRLAKNVYSPSVAGGMGYTGSGDGIMTAIDLPTGQERWVATFGGIVRAPAVAGDVIYVAADGERRIVALDAATGGALWSQPVDGENSCCLALAEGLVLAGTVPGTVYAIGGDGEPVTPSTRPSLSAPSSPSPSAAAVPPPTFETSLIWATTNGRPKFIPWNLTQAADGNLWVTEANEDRFSIFRTDGTYVESWGYSGSGSGQFDLTGAHENPWGAVAFAPDGSFYVLDAGNSRIQRFDRQRRYLGEWGSFGPLEGQFINAVGLAVGADGIVHVMDDVRRVIESFSPDGRLLRTIDAFPPELRPNQGANHLAIGPEGHFFTAVSAPGRVAELAGDGSLVRTFGGPGSGAEAFTEGVTTMAWDASERMYVTTGDKTEAPAVLVFDRDGTFLGGFGKRGSGRDELGFAFGIVVTEDGIYLTDAGALPEYGLSSYLRKFEPINFGSP